MSEDALPPGWALARFEEILVDPKADLVDGPFGSNLKSSEYVESGVPVLKIQNIKADRFVRKHFSYVTKQKSEELSRHSFVPGDLVITKLGDPLGLCCEVPNDFPAGVFVADLMRLRLRTNQVSKRFLLLAINSQVVQSQFKQITKGTTRPRVNLTIVRSLEIPLPPLAEQKRIVAKIEELFSELDAGEESLRRARRQLGVYRQSLLKQAFEGKLTAQWRKQHPDLLESATELFRRIQDRRVENWKGNGKCKDPVPPNEAFQAPLPDGWLLASMDALTLHITSGSRDWTKYYRDNGYAVFVMAQNVRPLKFDSTPVTRVSPPEFDRDKIRSAVACDDLLVTIVGANTGDVCRVDHEFEDYYVCQSVALLRPAESATAKYLELYMNSKEHGQKQFDQWMYGQGRPHLSFDQLRSTAICLPSLPEQQEIVRLLDEQFTVIEQNEREIDAALKRSAALRQSILKKAFTGQLVPQDPTDEPASALLERIRAQRATPPAKKPKRSVGSV